MGGKAGGGGGAGAGVSSTGASTFVASSNPEYDRLTLRRNILLYEEDVARRQFELSRSNIVSQPRLSLSERQQLRVGDVIANDNANFFEVTSTSRGVPTVRGLFARQSGRNVRIKLTTDNTDNFRKVSRTTALELTLSRRQLARKIREIRQVNDELFANVDRTRFS